MGNEKSTGRVTRNEVLKCFGLSLRAILHFRQLSMSQVWGPVQTISGIERGISAPSLNMVGALCEKLGVDMGLVFRIADLYRGTPLVERDLFEPCLGLGDSIKRARQWSGHSVTGIATAIGIHSAFMSHIENGTRKPSIVTLFRIADAAGCRVSDLFPGPCAGFGRVVKCQ